MQPSAAGLIDRNSEFGQRAVTDPVIDGTGPPSHDPAELDDSQPMRAPGAGRDGTSGRSEISSFRYFSRSFQFSHLFPHFLPDLTLASAAKA